MFTTASHLNYAKGAWLYVQMMNDLPFTFPDFHEQFTRKGYHVDRRRNRIWNGICTGLAIDQVLVHLLKTHVGLTRGREMTESVMLTWTHTMHVCAQVNVAMTQLTGNHHKTREDSVVERKS